MKADKKETEQQYIKSEEQRKKLSDKNSQLSKRVTELEEQVGQLENRPIEAAVDSINRLLSFLASNPDEEFFRNKTIEFFNRALCGAGNIKK